MCGESVCVRQRERERERARERERVCVSLSLSHTLSLSLSLFVRVSVALFVCASLCEYVQKEGGDGRLWVYTAGDRCCVALLRKTCGILLRNIRHASNTAAHHRQDEKRDRMRLLEHPHRPTRTPEYGRHCQHTAAGYKHGSYYSWEYSPGRFVCEAPRANSFVYNGKDVASLDRNA